MYLVSVYFDEKTEERIRSYIKQVATKTGNKFMMDGNVPPHITISSFETTDETAAIECVKACANALLKGEVHFATVGEFFPYVIYIAPVLNEYLHKMSVEVYKSVTSISDVSVSQFYRPLQWIPHTTIGKKLSKEEMKVAFEILQNQFGDFRGTVTRIGLAKTNPYENLVEYTLR